MFRNITATVVAITTLLGSSPAIAAHEAYMTVKGQKAGLVKGGATARGQEGSIVVLSTSLGITSPRDVASGLPTGQRVHQPIVITKELDKSSPILWNMLVTNENISSLTIKYVRAAANGAESQIYRNQTNQREYLFDHVPSAQCSSRGFARRERIRGCCVHVSEDRVDVDRRRHHVHG